MMHSVMARDHNPTPFDLEQALESNSLAAQNQQAAIEHPGLLHRQGDRLYLSIEEPFREPPYWLFEGI